MKGKLWWWLMAIWLMGILAYSNSLHGPFVFDDLTQIVGNSALQRFDIGDLWRHYPTRFVPYLTLAANYAMSELDATGYHVVNILIHLATATVVFFLTKVLAELTGIKRARLVAGICALLFVSHPIQTQAVTYTIQRLTSLTALLYLGGLLIYVWALRKSSPWLHAAAFTSIILAMFSKEIAFTAPFTIVMLECFFFRRNKPRFATPEEQAAASTSGVLYARALPYLLLLAIIPLTLWWQKPELIERDGVLAPSTARPLARETSAISRKDYLFTQINVMGTYLRLLVLPVNQNLDYDYPVTPSLFEIRPLASLAGLVAVAGLGVWLYPRNRLASFGIFFFFLALSVESSVIPIRDVIYEHRLYLPSFGIFLTVAALARSRRVHMTLLGAVVFLAALTYMRNEVWRDDVLLWQDVTEKSPGKARGFLNLGTIYFQRGETRLAREYFTKALERDQNYAESYNNLGLIETQAGNLKQAADLFRRALAIEPEYTHALNNLAVVDIKQDKLDEARVLLERAIALDPDFPDAQNNLQVILKR